MLFQYGAELGYNFTVLDIGGGFPESEHAFRETATGVMKSVAKFTARYPKTEVITEPGVFHATVDIPGEGRGGEGRGYHNSTLRAMIIHELWLCIHPQPW